MNDDTNLAILEEQLASWNAEVFAAESGQTAIDAVRAAARAKTPMSLIITDMQMPGMDGLSLTPGPPRTRIMVVDDDAICLEVTRDRLTSAGYEVILRDAALGTSAAIMRERPHVVLLDQDMPGLTGEQLAQLLRGQHDQRVALILYSSEPLSSLTERAKRCGAAGVIEKTSSDRRFLEQLSSCLRSIG